MLLAALVPAFIQGQETELVDRILAVVNDVPVLASDLEQMITLGLVEPEPGESEEEFRRRALQWVIDRQLRLQEIERFGFGQLPLREVERQYQSIRARFPSEEVFLSRLERVGLTPEGLRQLIARQLSILVFVEERLGPRVFVSLSEIRQHYESVLLPEMRRRDVEPPPLEEVRESIRELLRERRLNEEIERWTEELRQEADILNYQDHRHQSLPPVVEP